MRKACEAEHSGIRVWLDQAEMHPGDSLLEKIGDAIAEIDALAVVLSPSSAESDWVQRELQLVVREQAAGKPLRVIPLLYRTCLLQDWLSDRFSLDFREGSTYDFFLRQLVAVVRGEEPRPVRSYRAELRTLIESLPVNARAFGKDFTFSDARTHTAELTDEQVRVLHDLRARGFATGDWIVYRSEVLRVIGDVLQASAAELGISSALHRAGSIFDSLASIGSLERSYDLLREDERDQRYVLTPLFAGYTNLMRYAGIGSYTSATLNLSVQITGSLRRVERPEQAEAGGFCEARRRCAVTWDGGSAD